MEDTSRSIRESLKSLGYKMELVKCSEFYAGRIKSLESGLQINGGLCTREHYECHKPLYDYLASLKGKAYRNGLKIIF